MVGGTKTSDGKAYLPRWLVPIFLAGLLLLAGCSSPILRSYAEHCQKARSSQKTIAKDVERLKQVDSELSELRSDYVAGHNQINNILNARQLVKKTLFNKQHTLLTQMDKKYSEADTILAEIKRNTLAEKKQWQDANKVLQDAKKGSPSPWFKEYVDKSMQINNKYFRRCEARYDFYTCQWLGAKYQLKFDKAKLKQQEKLNGAGFYGRQAAIREWNRLADKLNPKVDTNNERKSRLKGEIDQLGGEITNLQKARRKIVNANWYRAILERKIEVLTLGS